MRTAKLAAAAAALKQASGAPAPVSLAFMTDAMRVSHPELVARTLPRGAALIFRDYAAQHREALARRLQAICRTRGVLFFVGGDIALANKVGADGLHLPSWRLEENVAANGMMVSAACHNAEELKRAHVLGADVALLSPVFTTKSHAGEPPMGAARFCTLAATASLPVLALGGVDENNAPALRGENICGIAAIGAFLPSPHQCKN